MKKYIKYLKSPIVIGILFFALGFGAAQLNPREVIIVKTDSKHQDLKRVDNQIFSAYKEGIFLAAEGFGCLDKLDEDICLKDKVDKIDALKPKLEELYNERRAYE